MFDIECTLIYPTPPIAGYVKSCITHRINAGKYGISVESIALKRLCLCVLYTQKEKKKYEQKNSLEMQNQNENKLKRAKNLV